MAQHLSVVVDDRPGALVSVAEATPRTGAKTRRWVDDLETARAGVRGERRGSRVLA
jgi:hypothetical protein